MNGLLSKPWITKATGTLLIMALLLTCLTGFAQTTRASSPHIVTIKEGPGFTLTDTNGNQLANSFEVADTSDLYFKLAVSDGYTADELSVYANNKKLRAQNGVYAICAITCDITISVKGAAASAFKVTLPKNDEKYTLTPDEGNDKNSVPYGSDFTFSLLLNEKYASVTPTVFANGKALDGKKYEGKWWYTIENVTRNYKVTVDDDTWLNGRYAITFPKDNEKFTIERKSDKVSHGSDYSFVIVPAKDYKNAAAPKVYANDTALDFVQVSDGFKYTIKNVTNDQIITVDVSHWDNIQKQYKVSFASGKEYSVKNVLGGVLQNDKTYLVKKGGNLSFTLEANKGYGDEKFVVTANGKTLTAKKGVYTVSDIQKDVAVKISLASALQYTVKFRAGDGTRVTEVKGGTLLEDGRYIVNHGKSMTFEVYVKESNKDKLVTVKANGATIKSSNGVYTLADIREDIEVVISINTKLKRFTLTDEATGIKVTGYSEGSPKLVVEKLSDTSDAYKKLNGYTDDLKVLGAFKIYLTGAKHVGDVNVTFPVNEDYNSMRIRVLRTQNKGKVAKYTPKVRNGSATVTVAALSDFMLAGVADPTVIKPPATGPTDRGLVPVGYMCLLMAGMLMVAVIKKRRGVLENK